MSNSNAETRQYFTVFLEDLTGDERREKNLELYRKVNEGEEVFAHRLNCSAFKDSTEYNIEVYVVKPFSFSHNSNVYNGSKWEDRLAAAGYKNIKPKGEWLKGTEYRIPKARPLPPPKSPRTKVL